MTTNVGSHHELHRKLFKPLYSVVGSEHQLHPVDQELEFYITNAKVREYNMEYCCNVDVVDAVVAFKQLQNPKKLF